MDYAPWMPWTPTGYLEPSSYPQFCLAPTKCWPNSSLTEWQANEIVSYVLSDSSMAATEVGKATAFLMARGFYRQADQLRKTPGPMQLPLGRVNL